MSQQRYTIVIENGKLVGISQHTGNLDAVPVNLADLKKEVKEINDSALARMADVDAEIAAAKSDADEAKASLSTIESAIADPDVDDAVAVQIAKNELAKTKLSKAQKEKAAIRAQIAELQAKLKD